MMLVPNAQEFLKAVSTGDEGIVTLTHTDDLVIVLARLREVCAHLDLPHGLRVIAGEGYERHLLVSKRTLRIAPEVLERLGAMRPLREALDEFDRRMDEADVNVFAANVIRAAKEVIATHV